MQHTHKRNFRLDANKDYARDGWFTRNLLAKIAPKKDSKLVTQLFFCQKLVTQLDIKFSTCAYQQSDLPPFFTNFLNTIFFCCNFSFLFFLLFFLNNTKT